MRRINKFLFISFLALNFSLFYSCATNSVLTDALLAMEELTEDDQKASAVFGFAASVSKAAEDITPENEYWIGRSVAASILVQYKVYNNPKKEAYVNQIAQALLVNSDAADLYDGYHVKILDTDEMNAFATSGGHIFVTRGMLECAESEDALAAAIAHEISHIQLKHSSSVIKSSRYTSVATKGASAVLSMADENELASAMDDAVGETINQLVTKGYSKEQEFAADENAIKLMNNAGYNPKAMISLLTLMDKKYGSSSGGMFKTHPSPAERITNVEKNLKKMEICKDTSKYRTSRFNSIMK